MRRLLVLLFAFCPIFAWAGLIDLNAATSAELEGLPGIGASKAAAIIQYRTDHGGFKSVDELDNVPGIGEATMANLRPLVTVGAAKASTGGEKPPAEAPATPTATVTPSAPAAGCPVNINAADASALQNLPGIGESKAGAILQHRLDHGPFATCDALDDVPGIGPATIAGLRECCAVK
ncbi:MAG TPA: ComEA family DNA-binding protein [Myxococcota bacterium]|nr:ComEA family DNA-binding protein [Myxococcota bacterium]